MPLEDIKASNELGGGLRASLMFVSPAAKPLDQVIEFLRERQTLLVLDNFEQLAHDASILERLLQACTGLKILVTSRVRLAVSMEWLLPLGAQAEDQDRFEAFDAVRLFVQAAQRRAYIGPSSGSSVDRRHLSATRGFATGVGTGCGMDASVVVRRSQPSCVREPSCCMRSMPLIQRGTPVSTSCSTSRGDCSARSNVTLSRLSVSRRFFGRSRARNRGCVASGVGRASG